MSLVKVNQTKLEEIKSKQVRETRDELLKACDWRAIKAQEQGVELDSAWVDYRQALRGITEQTGFPEDIEWPVKPEE